jgi:ribosomal protein S18 acetylase RimI-like enzyme
VEEGDIAFRKARIHEKHDIHLVLSEAFEPYKKDYTKGAFTATVLTPNDIQNRIVDQTYEISVVVLNKRIVGTVSVSERDHDQLHIRSMAVHPDYQKRGIGFFMVQKIVELAKRKNFKMISLDTSKPLQGAITFYTNVGFAFTGVTKNFYGVEIFEMIRML